MAGSGMQHSGARLLSFLLASALSVLILVYPRAVASGLSEVRHGLLALLMWGIAAGFVHGVGYTPVHRVWRLSLGPWVGWPLMIGGICWLLLKG
jgi:cyd operon protein YbgE